MNVLRSLNQVKYGEKLKSIEALEYMRSGHDIWFLLLCSIGIPWIMFCLLASLAWKLRDAIPLEMHLSLGQEILSIDWEWSEHSSAVQSTIGPHFQRNDITIMGQQTSGECLHL